MKLLDVYNVKIGDNDFYCAWTNRVNIALSNTKLEGLERLDFIFYCTAKAGAKIKGLEFTYSFEEFLDVIDMYPKEILEKFTPALEKMNNEASEPADPQEEKKK